MRWFLNLSIRNKLVLIIVFVSMVAIAIGATSALMLEIKHHRESMVEEATVMARTVSAYTATDLAFDDKKAARSSLQSLHDMPDVVNAHLYDVNGSHFVSLRQDPVNLQLKVDRLKSRFDEQQLHVYHPVVYEGRDYGTLHLIISSVSFNEEVRYYIVNTAFIALAVLLLASVLAAKLQALISRPILELTDIAKRISQQPDYSVRATTNLKDEVGTLYDAFNEMLEQIKQRETAMQQSEEKWRSLTEYSPDQILLLNRTYEIVFINRTDTDMIKEKTIGKRILDFFPEESRRTMSAAYSSVFRTGNPERYEVEYQSSNGIRNYESLVGPVKSGDEVVALTVSTRDITERKKAELERARALKRLEILRNIDAGILRAQSSKDVATAALFGLDELVASDRSSVTLLDFDAQQGFILAQRGSANTPLQVSEGFSLEVAFANIDLLRQGKVNACADIRDDSNVPVLRSLAAAGIKAYINIPLVARGQVIGALNMGRRNKNGFDEEDIAIAKDIADVIAIAIQQADLHEQITAHAEELEIRVHQRTAALEVANRELESFSYSVSHDLRAPLRSIDGFSHALMEDHAEQLDAEGKDYLQRIRRASQRMGQLIDDLLTLSRINRSEISRQRINIGELAHDVANTLRHTDPEQKVKLIIKEPLVVHADPQLMRLVLENLLGNAWKFTANRSQPIVEIGSIRKDGKDVYYVRDNGAGFDMQYVDKLFGAFQRLHSAEEFAGTGIGLASVQRIIHRHGGHVWAEGKLHEGATFYFTLGDTEQVGKYSATG
jgi:PAS domain S-box-containing protein